MSASGQSIFRERWIIDSASQLQSSDQKIHGPDGDLTCLGSLRHIWQLLFYGIQKAFSHSRYRRAASPAPNAKSQEEAPKPRRESPLTGGNTCHIWSRQREKNGIDRRPNRSRKLGPGAPLGALEGKHLGITGEEAESGIVESTQFPGRPQASTSRRCS